MILYYLEQLLPHLAGPYASYPLLTSAIRNVLPVVEFCIDPDRRIDHGMLSVNASELCKDLRAAFAAVLGKELKDMGKRALRSL
jgi:hypothetical protein